MNTAPTPVPDTCPTGGRHLLRHAHIAELLRQPCTPAQRQRIQRTLAAHLHHCAPCTGHLPADPATDPALVDYALSCWLRDLDDNRTGRMPAYALGGMPDTVVISPVTVSVLVALPLQPNPYDPNVAAVLPDHVAYRTGPLSPADRATVWGDVLRAMRDIHTPA